MAARRDGRRPREGPRPEPGVPGLGMAPDRLEGGAARPRARWDRALVWFMRLAALAWLAKGVANWAEIVGALPAPPFDAEPIGRQSAIVYFGVIDCVAAVALWLAGAWGGVVWLFAATSALILAVFAPDLAPLSLPVAVLCSVSIVLYFALSWLASHEVR